MSFHDIEKRIHKGLSVDRASHQFWPKEYIRHPDHWLLSSIRIQQDADRVSEMVFQFNSVQGGSPLVVNMNAYQVRNWLNPSQLKSTRFQLEIKGRLAVFRGKGSGHGVGLCQWGAKRMGEQGFTREQILTHYYPGFKLVKI